MTPLQTNRTAAAHTILERCVVLTLACHYLGNDRKVDVADVVDAAVPDRDDKTLAVDAEQFRATRKLIDQKLLRPVMRPMRDAKRYLASIAIKGHRVFGERSYLVASGMVEEADARLERLAAEVWVNAGQLADVYQAAVDAQKAAQGPKLFKASDYATPARVRSSFMIDWDYVSFAAPERLEAINHVIASRANAKHEAKLASAYDEVVYGMRAAALDVVSELDDRLDVGSGERPKVLRSTALDDLRAFVSSLPKRNIADDDRLTAAMARLAARASGVTVDALKDDAGLRSALRSATAEARSALAALVDDAPVRQVSFGAVA